ncbi:MAG: peptidase domain protein [Deltaproteobacteria bacterium]|nr:peptidase domain protein [Deltaproteobacteria bacterium]
MIEANGLRFVIMPDSTTKLAEVDIRYDVGAREDPQGKAGLAHLVEHLMFQTRPDGANTAPLFQTIIDIATDFNAYTNWDTTHYRMTSQADNLDALLKIEAMRMYYAADLPPFGCSTLPAGEFEREREVVRNEIRAGSSANDYVVQLVEAAIYPKGHAYERLVGGNDAQIASASLADACEFMKKYYTPERATIVIAGAVDIAKTTEMIQKWFAKIPKRAATPRTEVTPFVAEHARKEIEADVERSAVWIGWALPPSNTPEGEAARFGIGSAFGRIAQKGQEYGFAYKVEPAILGGQLAPLFLVRIELKGLDKLDEALEFTKKATKQAYRGFDAGSEEDLEEEKNRQKASFIEGLERLSDRTEAVADMVQFARDFDFNSDRMYLFHQLDKIGKFDIARIGTAIKKSLDWDKAAIVVIKPNKEGVKGDTRSKVNFSAKSDAAMTDPEVDPNDARHTIKVAAQLDTLKSAQRFTMGNGMEVVLLPISAMPLAAATLVFKNVGQASTPDNPGIGGTAAAFLHRVGDMDPQGARNTDVFSRTGIDVGCRSSDDATYCSTHGVNIYLDVMVRGLERLITAGEYSQEQIERWQKGVREDWKLPSTQEDNEYVRQVFTALYGPDHAYTKTAVLKPDAANKVHADALASYRRKHFSAGNATLIIVGNFDLKYAEKLARSTFSGWDKGAVDKAVDPAPYKRTGATFVGVKKTKEDQQVTVTIAYPAPAGIDGQEGARRVLTEMLSTRAANVRFKLGSTYGLAMSRQPKKGPTAYTLRGGAVIGGTIDAERAGESIKALRDSFDELRAGKRFDEDFVRARRKILSQMLGESTVTTEIAGRLTSIALYGLDPNYYNTMLQQIAAVSTAQVKALLARELDPNNEVLVVLGDKAHLDKTFADAGIKDVKIVDPDLK